MSSEDKNKNQKVNRYGRPVVVYKNEYLEQAVKNVSKVSDTFGYLKDGASVFEDYNFSWWLIHSKNTPLLSKERLEEAKKFKIYQKNPDSGRIYKGNGSNTVFDTKKFVKKADKISKTLGNIADGSELILAVANRDPKALATKASTLILTKTTEKVGDAAGVAAVGKCVKVAVKKLDPRKATIMGLTCAGATVAVKYWLKDEAEKMGDKVGKTNTALEIAKGVLDANDKLDELDQKAAEKERQKAIKKDPMLEFDNYNSD